MVFGQKEELIFLGREISEQRDYSETIAEKIDQEVQILVREAHERAREILIEYRAQLDAIAQTLIELETINREAFEALSEQPVPEKNGGTPTPVPSN